MALTAHAISNGTSSIGYYQSSDDEEEKPFDIALEDVQSIHEMVVICKKHNANMMWSFKDAPECLTNYFNTGGDENLIMISHDDTPDVFNFNVHHTMHNWTIYFSNNDEACISVTEH